jgi:hypothetical protein
MIVSPMFMFVGLIAFPDIPLSTASCRFLCPPEFLCIQRVLVIQRKESGNPFTGAKSALSRGAVTPPRRGSAARPTDDMENSCHHIQLYMKYEAYRPLAGIGVLAKSLTRRGVLTI